MLPEGSPDYILVLSIGYVMAIVIEIMVLHCYNWDKVSTVNNLSLLFLVMRYLNLFLLESSYMCLYL